MDNNMENSTYSVQICVHVRDNGLPTKHDQFIMVTMDKIVKNERIITEKIPI